MITDSIKSKIQELFESTPSTTNVGFGYKIVDGVYTNELCFVFGVQEKKSIDSLPAHEVIPSEIEVDGIIYKTDVINNGVTFAAADPCNTGSCVTLNPTIAPYYIKVGIPISTKYDYGSNNADIPVPGNVNDLVKATLGSIVLDRTTQHILGLTSGHVLSRNMSIASQSTDLNNANPFCAPSQAFANGLSYPYVYAFYAPGTSFNAGIGMIHRYNPLYPTPVSGPITYNQADAGVIGILGTKDDAYRSIFVSTEAYKIEGYDDFLYEPMTFATTAELNALLVDPNLELMCKGYDQLKHGSICGLKLNAIDVSLTMTYSTTTQTFPFNNIISFSRINPACPAPVIPGDSGATLCAKIGGKWKIIGVVMGGNDTIGYACRIDYVADQLDIDAWTNIYSSGPYANIGHINQNPSYGGVIPPNFITQSGLSSQKSITVNGIKYWQVGTTNQTL